MNAFAVLVQEIGEYVAARDRLDDFACQRAQRREADLEREG